MGRIIIAGLGNFTHPNTRHRQETSATVTIWATYPVNFQRWASCAGIARGEMERPVSIRTKTPGMVGQGTCGNLQRRDYS